MRKNIKNKKILFHEFVYLIHYSLYEIYRIILFEYNIMLLPFFFTRICLFASITRCTPLHRIK